MKFYSALTLFVLAILTIIRPWFSWKPLSGGDWIYLFPKSTEAISPFSSWDLTFNGMGWSILPTLWVQSYSFSTLKLSPFFSWILYERMFWFFPIVIISVISSFKLANYIIKDKLFSLFSPIIFLFNTYVLLLISGGQVGVAMGYSLTPITILMFIKSLKEYKILNSLLFSLTLSTQMIFDIRLAYISLIAIFIYFLFNLYFQKNGLLLGIKLFLKNLILSLILTFILHSFWILPILFSNLNPVSQYGPAYNTVEGVKFLSFAKFENTLSLLHPNWPENIFGKVGFLKPEFLILPVLAYLSLLFINSKLPPSPRLRRASKTQKNSAIEQSSNKIIIFFAFLGLLGAFLAKGANEPFGGVYLWLFDNFPGFIMFRDPTKWYTLVAISYSILIPFSVWKIYEWLKSHSEFLIFNFPFGLAKGGQFSIKSKIFNFQNLFLLFIVFCLLYLIRPALFGQLSGTFKPNSIPREYIQLEKFLSSDTTFYRTFWVPVHQRFALYSNTHPSVSGNDFFKVSSPFAVINELKKKESKKIIEESSVKYVLVPFDSKGEIFLKDRKYDEKQYIETIKGLRKIRWLKEVDCSIAKLLNCSGNPFGKIAVFELPNPKDHFWTATSNLNLKYKYVSPVEYKLEVKNARKGDVIVFSESYDAGWIASTVSGIKYKVLSIKYDGRFNSFVLPADGNYSLKIYYTPQDYVNIGMIVSGLTLLSVLGILVYLKKKKI